MAALAENAINAAIEAYAKEESAATAAAINSNRRDFAAQKQSLYDLKLASARKAADLARYDLSSPVVSELGAALPEYDTSALYQARSSLLALASAVLLGWLIGGILATFLGFLGLGGEIFRPLAILACLWLEEYLGVNPKARRIMLAVLGLGALGRFAAALASGFARLTGVNGVSRLVFGSGVRFGFFKSIWLWAGAIFLLVFFSRKTSGLDIKSFEASIEKQTSQRMSFLVKAFQALASCQEKIAFLEKAAGKNSALCPKGDCELARAVIGMLGDLDRNQAKWLAGVLRRLGYDPKEPEKDTLVWNGERDGAEYDALGLVSDGDRCLILERPYSANGQLKRGLVQRLPEEAR